MSEDNLPVEKQVYIRYMGWMPNPIGMHSKVAYTEAIWELLSTLQPEDMLDIKGLGTGFRVDRVVEGQYMNYNGDGRIEHLNVWCWRGELEERWRGVL